MFLLGGTLALDELHFDTGEQRHLKELLLESSESSVPYIVKLAEYLTNTIPVISSSLELLFDWYSKKPITTKKVHVAPIGQRRTSITTSPLSSSHTNSSSCSSYNE